MNKAAAQASRIVSIDFGLKRIGMALSDDRKIIASPWKLLIAEKRSEQTVKKVMEELAKIEAERCCTISEVVVGMPLLMNGKIGLLGDEVKHFVDLLRQNSPIPILTWDERLTSVQAERSMREAHMTRKQRSQFVDSVSAVIILQSYLEHICNKNI